MERILCQRRGNDSLKAILATLSEQARRPQTALPKNNLEEKGSSGILLNETVLKATTFESQIYGKKHSISDLSNYRAS